MMKYNKIIFFWSGTFRSNLSTNINFDTQIRNKPYILSTKRLDKNFYSKF